MTFSARKQLEAAYNRGDKIADIAAALFVHPATVYRDLTRGATGEMDKNGRPGYSAETAQRNTIRTRKNAVPAGQENGKEADE